MFNSVVSWPASACRKSFYVAANWVPWIRVLEIEEARKAAQLQHDNLPLQEHPEVNISLDVPHLNPKTLNPKTLDLHEYSKVYIA